MAGAAFAADLPVSGPYRPGPFMVRQPVEWTGIYFGANAGYGWGQYSSNIAFTGLQANSPPLFPAGTTTPFGLGATELSGTRILGSGSPNGAIAGGQIGFNWQAGMFVFGGEIDGQWSGQQNTFTTPCGATCTATESIQIRSLATGRGRFGLAFDWFMPYVTGGAALVNGLNNLSMTVAGTTASFAPLSHSTLGWTAGAGVEVALWSNWSAKLEYLYISANGATKIAPIPNVLGLGTVSTPGDYRDNIVRVGFNYRFGPRGGPGLLESPLPARDAFASNYDFLPNLQFATDRANVQVAASRAKSPDHLQARPVVAQDVAAQAAPAASEAEPVARQAAAPRQAPPRQVASATNEPQFLMADDDVIYTDTIVTETRPARQAAKKRPEREEDESARMKRIMSICSGC
ncbi:MAG: outer rane immunogenic protein [Alphaproteobacteria bacterium]|nr:outer rane immunogenic protein [Alphaproteobacteria bacterium]